MVKKNVVAATVDPNAIMVERVTELFPLLLSTTVVKRGVSVPEVGGAIDEATSEAGLALREKFSRCYYLADGEVTALVNCVRRGRYLGPSIAIEDDSYGQMVTVTVSLELCA
jgi:hypothetical protein